MNHRLNALAIGTIAATALAITYDAGIASAHTPAVSAACKNNVPTGTAGFTQYNATGNQNTIQIYDDGVKIVDTTFGGSFPTTDYNLGSPSETHTFRVKVVAFDDAQYNFDQTLTVPVCQATTTTSSTTSTTTPPSSTTVPPTTAAPTTAPPTTAPPTTAPTTTAPETSAPTTTAAAETTTTNGGESPEAAVAPPVAPPTTAEIAVAPPVPATPPAGLPETGADTTTSIVLGGLGLASGTALLAIRRRRLKA